MAGSTNGPDDPLGASGRSHGSGGPKQPTRSKSTPIPRSSSSSSSRNRSSSHNKSPRSRRTEEDLSASVHRKENVKESLLKFLDDCDNEDSFAVQDDVVSASGRPRSESGRYKKGTRTSSSSSSSNRRDDLRRSKSERHRSRPERAERSSSDSGVHHHHHHHHKGSSSSSTSSKGDRSTSSHSSRSSNKSSSSRNSSSSRSSTKDKVSQSAHIPGSASRAASLETFEEGDEESDSGASFGEEVEVERHSLRRHNSTRSTGSRSRTPTGGRSKKPSKSKSTPIATSSHSKQRKATRRESETGSVFLDSSEGDEEDLYADEDDDDDDLSRPSRPRRAVSDGPGMGGFLDRQLARENRRATFKATYRDSSSVVSGYSRGVRAGGGSDGTAITSASSMSSVSRTPSRAGSRAPNIDGGPLNVILNKHRHDQQRKLSLNQMIQDGNSADEDHDDQSVDERSAVSEHWVQQRARNQDEILNAAKQDQWEKDADEAGRRDSMEQVKNVNDEDGGGGEGGGVFNGDGDDDQPMMKQKGRTPLDQVFRTVRKTAHASRSAAKGSVNAVKDPKRAAKKVGGLSKGMAKGTVNAVLDPTKTAKRVGKLTKTGVFGTINVATGVTTVTAKAGFLATKVVAKTGMGATNMVVGATTDGLGKVVHGVTGFIGGGHDATEEDLVEYHARNLPERRKTNMSLLDRVSGVAAEEEKARNSPLKSPKEKRLLMNGSMMAPIGMNLNAAQQRGSWDVNRDYT